MRYNIIASLYMTLKLFIKEYAVEKQAFIPNFLIDGLINIMSLVINDIGEKTVYTMTEFCIIDLYRTIQNIDYTYRIENKCIIKDITEFMNTVSLLEKAAREENKQETLV